MKLLTVRGQVVFPSISFYKLFVADTMGITNKASFNLEPFMYSNHGIVCDFVVDITSQQLSLLQIILDKHVYTSDMFDYIQE